MTIGREYEVIGIEADSYRIVSDDTEPCLYEPEQFEITEPSHPDFWVKEYGDDGELYAYPMAWFYNYFFERYFNNEVGFTESFRKEHQRLYPFL